MNFKTLFISIFSVLIIAGCQQGKEKAQSNEFGDEQSMQDEDIYNQLFQDQQFEPVTDEELRQFAEVIIDLQNVNIGMQQKFIDVLEKEGLNVQRFNEIMQSQQNPELDAGITQDEENKLEASNKEMEKIHMDSQLEMQELIEDAGFTIERYQEISYLVQNDLDLQDKLEALLE